MVLPDAGRPDIGRIVNARYQLHQRLRLGGMGVVFHATDQRDHGRSVAIKFLPHSLDPNDTVYPLIQKRFQEEAQLSSLLGNHPNILEVLDYGFDGSTPYWVTRALGLPPLVGKSLADIIHTESPLAPERMLRIAHQICAGLNYAHRFEAELGSRTIHSVPHLDLRPQNIFLVQDTSSPHPTERVQLIDFGVASIVREISIQLGRDSIEFIGSPRYSSPEQLQGLPADQRADIYSLAIILYEMITAHHPFQASSDSLWAWQDAHTSQTPTPIELFQLKYPVSKNLSQLLMQCLHRDPQQRPQSLDQVIQSLSIAPKPISKSSRRGATIPIWHDPSQFPDPDLHKILPTPPSPPNPSEALDPYPLGFQSTLQPSAESSPTATDPQADQPQSSRRPRSPNLQKKAHAKSTRRRPSKKLSSPPLTEETPATDSLDPPLPPAKSRQPWGWLFGILVLLLIGGGYASWRWYFNPNGIKILPAIPYSTLTTREELNESRKQAIMKQDWQGAINVINRLIADYPAEADLWIAYRDQLALNLKIPEVMPIRAPIQRILEVYETRITTAIEQGLWSEAANTLDLARTRFPNETEEWQAYTEFFKKAEDLILAEDLDQLYDHLEQFKSEFPPLTYSIETYQRILRPPTPTPAPTPYTRRTPIIPFRLPRPFQQATPTPTPLPTPPPTPIPRYTPIQVPTLDPNATPNLDFVCRLQPNLSVCKSRNSSGSN